MENEQIDTSSINYIFAKYWKPNYYSYTINNMENFKIIKKDMLINILDSLGYKNYEKLQYLTQRYLPFAYIKESNKIIEYESSDVSDTEIKNEIESNMKNSINQNKDSLKIKWADIFKSYLPNKLKINFS